MHLLPYFPVVQPDPKHLYPELSPAELKLYVQENRIISTALVGLLYGAQDKEVRDLLKQKVRE